MPKTSSEVADNPQVQAQEQAKTRVQNEAVRQGAEALGQYVSDLLKSLLGDLGDKPGVDNRTMDAAKQQVDARLDSLDKAVDALERTEPAQEDKRLAEDLGAAIGSRAKLGQVQELIYRTAEQTRQTIRQKLDPHASDEQLALEMENQKAAMARRQWLDQARDAAHAAETLHNLSDQLRTIQEDLAQTGAANEAVQKLAEMTGHLALSVAQRAFATTFSGTPALENTWARARESVDLERDTAWARVRERFWRRVNLGIDHDARSVAGILKAAGYQLGHGKQAPVLAMQWDLSKDDLAQSENEINHKRNVNVAQRRLTIDHADPQTRNPEQRFDCKNIRFMSGWDNSVRGDRFTGMDERDTGKNAVSDERQKAGLDHEGDE